MKTCFLLILNQVDTEAAVNSMKNHEIMYHEIWPENERNKE